VSPSLVNLEKNYMDKIKYDPTMTLKQPIQKNWRTKEFVRQIMSGWAETYIACRGRMCWEGPNLAQGWTYAEGVDALGIDVDGIV